MSVSKRGQKLCPKCNKGCGPRTFLCSCGHDFKPGEKPKTVAPVLGIGKGKKECPKCKTIVGARSGLCSCGYEFIPGSAATQTVVAEPKEQKKVVDSVLDWKSLEKGTVVKVLPGAGDHYFDESNNKVYLQDSGTFTIEDLDNFGLIVHGSSGHGYIYMGESKMSSVSSMIHKEAHKLAVVGRKLPRSS